MELEELKKEWKVFEDKISKTKAINDLLIETIIKERSISRVARMKQQYKGFFIILGIEACALVAVLVGNPFDFNQKWQYLPYLGLLAGIVLAIVSMLRFYKKLDFDFAQKSIAEFLRSMIDYYEKNKVYERWFGIIFLSIGFLLPLSFLPHKLEKYGLWKGIGDIAIMMAVTLVIYLIAFKMGAFRNRHEIKIKSDLQEYESLKNISDELAF
ncbi:MAG: hypothetical protein V4683_12875 [Bacteroidota bacterium]